MSGLPGLMLWRRMVRATYTINGRPMTDDERREFDAKFDEFERRFDEVFRNNRG